MSKNGRPDRIVVVGGGAGGLQLVRALGERFGKEADVILVDRSPTHVWKPLFHEVATGALDADLDEVSYRYHGKHWGYHYVRGTLEDIDRKNHEIILEPLVDEEGHKISDQERLRYDYLVLALGSVANDFNTPGVRENCLFLDSRAQADRFREHLFDACASASRTMIAQPGMEKPVRVTVIGAGATGVELSAELYNTAIELGNFGLEKFGANCMKVTLVEAAPRILAPLPEFMAEDAHTVLQRLGVDIKTNTMVVEAGEGFIKTKDGQTIESDIQLWAAGVKAPDFLSKVEGLEVARSNQIIVKPTLQSTTDDRIFAMGDCCSCKLPEAERPVPPRAQAAHQMADTVFENIVRLRKGEPLKDFAYRDYGTLLSLSRFAAIGDLSLSGKKNVGKRVVKGRIARFFYNSLYRLHLLAIHGWVKGSAVLAAAMAHSMLRPKVKLY
ncbi:NADH dehydrogenase [Zymomonas mobilis]|uniref:NAD(P)/FAD-dependent oxidoreductase n=1 Tax=Zymomonas mobilis TaxID=542 RepID=UPI00026D8635|nr:NAD(P)/FAD-dependent oxidoreductase [Zymomonas mobilis]AFN56117.1 NADH dehydrogenase [Zymomonas mobilis subsp. mobilis ATCC 29191]TQK78454.1 NADH dehydrogenase [Zymomonas mobilis]TQL16341.1 NADH dehydrogenase [Zymomonas mobilis]GEB87773.1 NADH dehydrogenase [Zymomonas mobilis subsp. mobilis]